MEHDKTLRAALPMICRLINLGGVVEQKKDGARVYFYTKEFLKNYLNAIGYTADSYTRRVKKAAINGTPITREDALNLMGETQWGYFDCMTGNFVDCPFLAHFMKLLAKQRNGSRVHPQAV